jgi:ligand-binding sensor domain-containing protein
MKKNVVFLCCFWVLFLGVLAASGQPLDIQNRVSILAPQDQTLANARIDGVSISPQNVVAWGTGKGVYLEQPNGVGQWFNNQNAPFKVEMFMAPTFYLGDFWVSARNPVEGQGLFRYNGKTWTRYHPNYSYMLSTVVSCTLVDSLNRLWIGYEERGIDRFIGHKFKGNATTLFEGIKAKHGLLPSAITALAESGGYIWVGTMMGLTRFQLPPESLEGSVEEGREEEIEFNQFLFPYFPANIVHGLAPYKNSVIAATERGVIIPVGRDWRLLKRKDGVAATTVRHIAADGNRVWIGSPAGVQLYENDRFSLPIKGLPTMAISALTVQSMADGSTKIFVGTPKGARLILFK